MTPTDPLRSASQPQAVDAMLDEQPLMVLTPPLLQRLQTLGAVELIQLLLRSRQACLAPLLLASLPNSSET